MVKPAQQRRRRRARLPSGVEKHGAGYRGRAVVHGKRCKTAVFNTPEQAAEALDRLRAFEPGSAPLTLAGAFELVRQSLTIRSRSPATAGFYEQQFTLLLQRWPAETPLARITAPAIEAWMRLRLEQDHVSASTVCKGLQVLHRMFVLAIRNRRTTRITENPVTEIERPSVRAVRTPHLTLPEIRTVLARMRAWPNDAAAAWEADVVEALALLGVRRSEFARLRVEDVDLFRARLWIRGKCDNREVALPTELQPLLTRLVAAADPEGFLVPVAKNHKRAATPARARAFRVSRVFQKWAERLDIPFAAHRLRVSFATALVDAGTPAHELMAALGHSNIQMSMRYYRGKADAAKGRLGALARALAGEDPAAAEPHDDSAAASTQRSG